MKYNKLKYMLSNETHCYCSSITLKNETSSEVDYSEAI